MFFLKGRLELINNPYVGKNPCVIPRASIPNLILYIFSRTIKLHFVDINYNINSKKKVVPVVVILCSYENNFIQVPIS